MIGQQDAQGGDPGGDAHAVGEIEVGEIEAQGALALTTGGEGGDLGPAPLGLGGGQLTLDGQRAALEREREAGQRIAPPAPSEAPRMPRWLNASHWPPGRLRSTRRSLPSMLRSMMAPERPGSKR